MKQIFLSLIALFGLTANAEVHSLKKVLLNDLGLEVVYLGPEGTTLSHYNLRIANDLACKSRFGGEWRTLRNAIYAMTGGEPEPTKKAISDVLDANLPGTKPDQLYNKVVVTDLYGATHAYSAFIRTTSGEIGFTAWLSIFTSYPDKGDVYCAKKLP